MAYFSYVGADPGHFGLEFVKLLFGPFFIVTQKSHFLGLKPGQLSLQVVKAFLPFLVLKPLLESQQFVGLSVAVKDGDTPGWMMRWTP